MIEYIVIGLLITIAAAFTGWRAFQTVCVSKGKCNTGCGKCPSEREA